MRFILYYIIPLNIVFDILLAFFSKGGALPIIRASLMLMIVFVFVIRKPQNIRNFSFLILFTIYVLINILFSSNMLISASNSLKVLISMLFLIVGYEFFNTPYRFKILLKSLIASSIILVINFILSNIFNIGISSYTEDQSFLMGNLGDSWYLLSYCVLLYPLFNEFLKISTIKKNIVALIFFILMLLLIISLKRTAILTLIFGLLIYGFFNLKIKQFLKISLFIGFVSVVTYPFYAPILEKRFDAREKRFDDDAIEEEGRYLETLYVWDEIQDFNEPIKQLFGLEAFYSAGNYAKGRFGERNLHVDYNLIVNSIGIVGLLMYFLVFYGIYNLYKTEFKKLKFKKSNKIKTLKATFYMLFLTQFVTSFGGKMIGISFRLIIFVFLGAIISLIGYYASQQNKKVIKS
ncbi:MAG: hypothetical protein WEA99_15530 [Brumimicrobium sp.]